METILWHDYETTGISPSQDRAVQFAAVRTDLDLQPVDEPLVVYCKLADDCVPSPYACLVTGISPQFADKEGLTEPEFVRRIQAEMIEPETCTAGYNSIRFDDEVTRYSLYRNFMDPYAREWKGGNSRWDIIDMVRLVHLLRPETLEWPKNEQGVTSFRLELLTAANGIEHGSAHDALSDVEATIELARLIKSRQPKLYDHYWKLRRKKFVSEQLDISAHKPFLHVSSRFPSNRGCAAILMPIIALKSNANAVVTIDLGFDPEQLAGIDQQQLSERIFSKSEDLAEGEQRVPIKLVHLNRSPVVLPVNMLSQNRAEEFAIDLELCQSHWHKLLSVELNRFDFDDVFGFEERSAQDPELALYEGFIPDTDRRTADSIHHMLPDELRLAKLQFQDKRLQEMLFRYRARNYPDSLSEEEKQIWQLWVHTKLENGEPYGVSIGECLNEIDQLLAERDSAGDKELLNQLQIWLHSLRSKYSQA
jgi:exodeoxyribonuclease I